MTIDDPSVVTGAPRLTPVARGVAAVLLVLLLWHVGATALWNMPGNPIRTDMRPTVADYLLPYFDQNWGLFAPDPINSNEHIQVRARLEGADGEVVETDWFDATAYEVRRILHDPFPSRAVRPSTTYYRNIASAVRSLSGEQRAVLLDDYSDGNWDRLAADLSAAGPARGVGDQIRLERMNAAYATGVARAVWGDHVVAVQIRLQGEQIPRFDDRLDPDAASTFSYTDFGWRPIWHMTDQDQQVFDEFFAGARS